MATSFLESRDVKVLVSGALMGGLLGVTTSYLISNNSESDLPKKLRRFCKQTVADAEEMSEDLAERGRGAWNAASNAAESVKETAECLWNSARSINGSTIMIGAVVGGILGVAAVGLATQITTKKIPGKKYASSSIDWINLSKNILAGIDSHLHQNLDADEEEDEDEENELHSSSGITLKDTVKWLGIGLRFLQNTQKKRKGNNHG